jgi:hypothetical protein
VLQACTLKRVKVYTDTPGNRIIELRNSSGAVLLDTLVNIPTDSSWVVLNFNLTPGNGYQLGTNQAQNNTALGFNSPRLKRSNAGVAYPYTINNLVSITNSNQSSSFYYYFYDWEIEQAPEYCAGPRTPVNVFISPVGIQSYANNGDIHIYPNPVTDALNIKWTNTESAKVSITIYDVMGKLVYTENTMMNADAIKTISTKNFAKGVYELVIVNGNKQTHQKLIVE